MATNEARTLIVKDSLITNANVLALVDGSETTLHSHAGGSGGDTLINRGDPAANDLVLASMTTDNTWRDWDMSAVVPAGATHVRLFIMMVDDSASRALQFRKNGNTNSYHATGGYLQVANTYYYFECTVPCDTNRIIEYRASNTTWTDIQIRILGWYI